MKSTLHALAFEFLHDIALQNDTNKRDLIGVNPQAILEIRELTEKMRNKIKIDQTYLVQFSLDLNLLNVFKRVFKPKMPFQDQFGAEMLNRLTIEYVYQAYCTNQLADCFKLGFLEREIKAVAGLTPEMRNHLTMNFVQLDIDLPALRNFKKRYAQDENYQSQIETAIILGATRDMMRQYAKLAAEDFKNIRYRLGLTEKVRQPSALNDHETQLVDSMLKELDVKALDLSQFIRISKQTEININRINAHIEQYWML